MEKRTFDIIMACKGQFSRIDCDINSNLAKLSPCERVIAYMYPAELNPYECVIAYMSQECDRPKSAYEMEKIMFDAMCDYLDTCDKPSYFMRMLMDIAGKEIYNRSEQIAIAFRLTQVKDDNGYINGFGKYKNILERT